MFRGPFMGDFHVGSALCAGFGASATLFLLPTLRTDSKVIERLNMTGIVITAVPAEINPKSIIGRGLSLAYVVELSDGTRINVGDSVRFPHSVGSEVVIERSTRENGSRFYMFSRPGNTNVPTF